MTTTYTQREDRPKTLRDVRVADAMHSGVVTCAPGASLQAVARTMAAHRIHAVVVPLEDPEAWGLVTDLDLIAAAHAGSDPTAGELASRPRLYVTPSDDIGRVAGLLRQDRLHHLIVLDDRGAHPVGIISTLDVADVLAELPSLESGARAGSGDGSLSPRINPELGPAPVRQLVRPAREYNDD